MNKQQTHSYSTTIAALMNETIYYIEDSGTDTLNSSEIINDKEKEVITPISFKYLGENKKKVLILLYNPNGALSKADLEFLMKVISAVGLTLEDIALLNYARYDSSNIVQLKKFFHCSKIITFALPNTLPIIQNAEELTVTNNNGIYFLNIPDTLAIIAQDKNKKLQLWNLLKSLFNVK